MKPKKRERQEGRAEEYVDEVTDILLGSVRVGRCISL
jgi:hypothetical protein